MLLETDPMIRVVGEARDGKEAAEMAKDLKPNILLMDLRMPRCNGLEALKLIQQLSLPVRILILATQVQKQEIVEALKNGASGVVLKETATNLLRKSISTVMAGQYWIEREGISDSITETQAGPRVVSREFTNKSWRLTPREEQIVAEVVSGKTNNEIAQALGMSAQTVKHHLTSIFDKVGVYNRLELALFYVNYSELSEAAAQETEKNALQAADNPNFPQNSADKAAPKPAEPLHFNAADRENRERGVKPQATQGNESAIVKRDSSRNIR